MNEGWQGGALSRRRFLAAATAAALMPGIACAQDARLDLHPLQVAAGRGEVYLLRGFADVFSRGLDEMGAELNALGVSAHVQGHLGWRGVARRIIADTKQNGRMPVVLVGHSLGANAVISIAERLAKEGIAVDYMATFAATAPDPVPGNVRRAVNYYFATNGWGEPLVPGPGFSGSLRNRDFSNSETIGHFNIDKQRPLQAEVVRDVLRTLGR
jgi:thioesterase domain-containing protein